MSTSNPSARAGQAKKSGSKATKKSVPSSSAVKSGGGVGTKEAEVARTLLKATLIEWDPAMGVVPTDIDITKLAEWITGGDGLRRVLALAPPVGEFEQDDDEGAALDRRAVDYLVQHFENMAKTDPVGTISVLRERLRVWTASYEALMERDAAARSRHVARGWRGRKQLAQVP